MTDPLTYRQLLVLTGFLSVAAIAPVAIALWMLLKARQRRRLLSERLGLTNAPDQAAVIAAAGDDRAPAGAGFTRLLEVFTSKVPSTQLIDTSLRDRVVRAGITSESAPAAFALGRLVVPVVLALLALLLTPSDNALLPPLLAILGLMIGFFGPVAILDRLGAQRQVEVRRAIPDALDLMIICLEAGVSQDAALQRVARELVTLHPALGEELLALARRTAAGMARERAFELLYERTGVDELRTLASHFIQADTWGTSITTVLRIYSDQLRKERRMAAERRAATASTRMLFPLAVFIFPTLFVVLLGPAGIRIAGIVGAVK